jgi:hypothetical protein
MTGAVLRPLLLALDFTGTEARFTVQTGRAVVLTAPMPLRVKLTERPEEVDVDVLAPDRAPLFAFSVRLDTPEGAALLARICRELSGEEEDVYAARAALPRVVRVIPGATWPAVTLELNTGARVSLSADTRASLLPVAADGLALLSYQWGRPDVAAYTVPAALMADLASYFPTQAQP